MYFFPYRACWAGEKVHLRYGVVMTQHTEDDWEEGAAYLRISDDKKQDGDAIRRQKKDVIARAARDHVRIRPEMIFIDPDLSGYDEDVWRPDFEKMMELAESGKMPPWLYLYKIDRATRKLGDAARMISVGNRYGWKIRETEGGTHDLGNSTGQFTFTIMTGLGSGESKIKSERVKRKWQELRDAGMIAGGRRSFGYDRKCNIIPKEAEALQWAYNALLQGESLSAIARGLNDLGVRTTQGKRNGKGSQSVRNGGAPGGLWDGNLVSQCLVKPVYAGILTYKGEELGRGAWTPIIDEATYYAALSILRDPARKSARGAKRLLTGIARCHCGELVNGGGSGAIRGSYACRTRHLSRSAEPIDALVVDAVLDRLSDPSARDHVRPDKADGTAELYADKRKAEASLDRLADALADGTMDNHRYNANVRKARDKIAEINAELARISASKVTTQLDALRAAGEDIRALWDSLSIDARRLVIDETAEIKIFKAPVGNRYFDPESVEIVFK